MKIGKGTSRTARWLLAVVMAFGASVAMAQIANTRHNLGTSAGNPGVTKLTAGTAEICVFCHTPHAADVSTAGIPLWNKRLNTGSATAFTTYASSTMNAVAATDGQGGGVIGSVSLACLSCHDGTQAMDNILNAPGSGGYDVTGGGTTGMPSTTYTWAAGGNSNADGLMTNAATTLSMLGRDLTNDHPIGIQYCGGGPGVTAPAAACNDTDFFAPQNATIGGATAFWVETGAAGTGRQKTDMILYNRSFPANGALLAGTYPSVECASCHDPHSSANATFLRIANTGSAVCLACHNK
ncbi:MAG: cytochrome c3 family protein [Sulfuritalea sp.]|nr:cytochrome c3 family protein [Sulfuritalea sp.]